MNGLDKIEPTVTTKGWWSDWGNCIAATVARGMQGAIVGCATTAAAFVTGTMVVARVFGYAGYSAALTAGGVGCVMGGIAGAVIGGIAGASESC